MSELSHDEESANAITHAVGLVFAAVGAVIVTVAAARHGDAWQLLACAIYAMTLIAAYAASTLSHVFRQPRARHAMRTADQAAIFLFIAGTWTPIAVAWLRDTTWWPLHGLIWIVALIGFASKAIFAHRVKIGAVSFVLYLILGWLPLLATRPLLATLPAPLSKWIVLGGICYTAGILFFCYDHRIRYFHAAWHVMVIAGSACHFGGIVMYCTGTRG